MSMKTKDFKVQGAFSNAAIQNWQKNLTLRFGKTAWVIEKA